MWFNIFERCPCCGEYLWFELGYDSPQHYAVDSYYMYCNVRYLPEVEVVEVDFIEEVD